MRAAMRCHSKELSMTVDSREFTKESISKSALEKVPYTFARKHSLLPLEENEETFFVLLSDHLNFHALDELRLMLDKKIKAIAAPQEKILSLINECYNHEAG